MASRGGVAPLGGVGSPKPVPERRPTWSLHSQITLYIICATQKQCRKLWKGLCR